MKMIKRLRSLPGDSLDVIRRTPPLVFAMAVLSLGGFIGASKVLVRGFRTVENTITVTGASTESFRFVISNLYGLRNGYVREQVRINTQ